jgi:hypothetical protein
MIDGVVELVIGAMLLLVGFGTWKVSKNPTANANFLKKWGLLFKIAGAFIVIVAIVRLVSGR